MKSILVYPKDGSDEALNFARQCALLIKSELCSNGHNTTEIEGDDADEHTIVNELTSHNEGGFFAFGHGCHELFTVHEDQRPVFFLRNTPNLYNLICYFLSCCTAKKIGPSAISNGAKAFIGFTDAFTFIPNYESIFIECATSGIRTFFQGKCKLDEIEPITMTSFETHISILTSHREHNAARYLLVDKNAMVFLFQ